MVLLISRTFPFSILVSFASPRWGTRDNLNQVAIHANTYGVYSEEIAVLQKDYAALWEPLSDLLEKLAEVVDM